MISWIFETTDSPEITLVDYNQNPPNRKERLKILLKMIAHSQYCQNGDNTIEAIEKATANVIRMDDQLLTNGGKADDYFVFAVSDANLSRYGITAEKLNEVRTLFMIKQYCSFSFSFLLLMFSSLRFSPLLDCFF